MPQLAKRSYFMFYWAEVLRKWPEAPQCFSFFVIGQKCHDGDAGKSPDYWPEMP